MPTIKAASGSLAYSDQFAFSVDQGHRKVRYRPDERGQHGTNHRRAAVESSGHVFRVIEPGNFSRSVIPGLEAKALALPAFSPFWPGEPARGRSNSSAPTAHQPAVGAALRRVYCQGHAQSGRQLQRK